MKFTLIYGKDAGWYVGRLKEVPGVISQGETLEELKENIAQRDTKSYFGVLVGFHVTTLICIVGLLIKIFS